MHFSSQVLVFHRNLCFLNSKLLFVIQSLVVLKPLLANPAYHLTFVRLSLGDLCASHASTHWAANSNVHEVLRTLAWDLPWQQTEVQTSLFTYCFPATAHSTQLIDTQYRPPSWGVDFESFFRSFSTRFRVSKTTRKQLEDNSKMTEKRLEIDFPGGGRWRGSTSRGEWAVAGKQYHYATPPLQYPLQPR